MNKKFINALLFSAALLSTGMVSSCKDYDDDIDALGNRVTAVETSIAELQKQIKEGKWVTSFEQSSNGYVLTLSDGSKLELKNGEKGDTGATGATGAAGINGTTWKIDEETKEWIKVNPDGSEEKTGIIAEGAKGDKGDQGDQGIQGPQGEQGIQGPAGENGKSPKIENGVWMVWDDEKKDYVEAGSAVGTASFVVEYDAFWELNMVVADAEGNVSTEFAKIILPKTADISSLKVYSFNSTTGRLNDPNYIPLYLGRILGGNEVKFNGKTYQPGEILVSKTTTLVAQVNPLKADASLYKFDLRNTKGETIFKVSEATQNVSEAPLTRATTEQTPNIGLWNISLEVPTGVVVESGDRTLYSLQTTSITDGETVIASDYEISFNIRSAIIVAPSIQQVTLEANKTISWATLLEEAISNYEEWEVADYYLEIPEDYTAQAEKDGVILDKEGKSLTITKSTSTSINYIRLHYLNLNGQVQSTDLQITVQSNSQASFDKAFVYDLNDADNKQITVNVIGNNALDGFNYTSAKATYKFASEVIVDGQVINQEDVDLSEILGNVTFGRTTDSKGYNQYTATMTFDKTKVFATDYDGTIELKNANNEVKTLNFKVQVKAPEARNLVAERNAAYFNGNAASAYSEISATAGMTEYDLRSLYGITDWTYISFSEDIPTKVDEDFPTPMLGKSWITSDGHTIVVGEYNGFDGAGSTRTMRTIYRPFGNKNLNASIDEFQLTVRSEINEGKFEYSSKLASQEITVGKTITLKKSDITATDVYGKTYDFTTNANNRVKGYKIEWDDNAKKYLNITDRYDASGNIAVTRKDAQTVVEVDTPCTATIIVTDAWGMTKSTKVTIVVKKN